MKKHPKAVWVGLGKSEIPFRVSINKIVASDYGTWTPVRYHLHPGNEVAKALNIIRGDVWYYKLNTTDKDVAETLRNNGIRVRWDAKKGRFV